MRFGGSELLSLSLRLDPDWSPAPNARARGRARAARRASSRRRSASWRSRACPIHSCRVRIGTPAAAIRVPNVCRRSWKRTSRTPAAFTAALNRLRTLERSSGLPVCGWANTRSSSAVYAELLRQRLQLGRDAIGQRHSPDPAPGLRRPVLAADVRRGEPAPCRRASPRRCQRSPSNSPWRSPVIAAVRYSGRSTEPSTSSGTATRTASSSSIVRKRISAARRAPRASPPA